MKHLRLARTTGALSLLSLLAGIAGCGGNDNPSGDGGTRDQGAGDTGTHPQVVVDAQVDLDWLAHEREMGR